MESKTFKLLAAEPAEEKSVRDLEKRDQKFQILVIEDDNDLKTSLCKVIQSIVPKSDVYWATTATQAFDHLRSNRIDIVISDYMLPETSTGLWIWEYCRRRFPQAPFLLMSGIPVKLSLR